MLLVMVLVKVSFRMVFYLHNPVTPSRNVKELWSQDIWKPSFTIRDSPATIVRCHILKKMVKGTGLSVAVTQTGASLSIQRT
jgi:hypothetical protein